MSVSPRLVQFIVSIGALGDPLSLALGRAMSRSATQVLVQVVKSADAARDAASLARGMDRVVAVGGDGTIGSVVTGLCQIEASERPELAVVAGGTANDFAVSVGIGALSLDDAVYLALTGSAVPVDVGHTSHRCFINMLTLGFPASLSEGTPRGLKDALGGLAYPLHGIANLGAWQPSVMRITSDKEQWAGQALAVFVANGRQVGGGIVVAPESCVDDGLFDVIIAPSMSAAELLPAAVSHLFDPNSRPASVRSFKCRWVQIDCEEPVDVSADGEVVRTRSLRAEVLPAAVSLVLPPKGEPS